MKGANPLKKPMDLKRFTLLHIGTFPDDWQVWLTAAGIKGVDATRGVTFDNSIVAYQAAIDGLGVALGRNPLVAADLKAGRLVAPFDFKMPSDLAYYVVYPAEAIRRRKIKAFRDWLMTLAEGAAPAGTPVPLKAA